MSEWPALVVAGGLGVFLGALFFGGLWWTIRKGVSSNRPALWFLGSLLLRMSTTLVGFYLVGRGHSTRLLVCLLGFVLASLAIRWLTRPRPEGRLRRAQEASHAP